MAKEDETDRTVQVRIGRGQAVPPKTTVVTGFRIRPGVPPAFLELLFEGPACKCERIILDTALLRSNLGVFKKYTAKLKVEVDDAAQKSEIAIAETATFSNILHFSQMGGIAETVFGVFSISDWVEATRNPSAKVVEINSADAIRLMSTTSFQKKLLNELILAVSEKEQA